MEAQIEWKDEFNIGVDSIDSEHQRLFRIVNKLFRFRQEEKDSQIGRASCRERV